MHAYTKAVYYKIPRQGKKEEKKEEKNWENSIAFELVL